MSINNQLFLISVKYFEICLSIVDSLNLLGIDHTSWNPVVHRAGGTQRLPRLVGKAIAKDIIFTGRKINGKEALSMGMLISRSAIFFF